MQTLPYRSFFIVEKPLRLAISKACVPKSIDENDESCSFALIVREVSLVGVNVYDMDLPYKTFRFDLQDEHELSK